MLTFFLLVISTVKTNHNFYGSIMLSISHALNFITSVKRVKVKLSQPAMSMNEALTMPLKKKLSSTFIAKDAPEFPTSRHWPLLRPPAQNVLFVEIVKNRG